jgi:hypothetical protein
MKEKPAMDRVQFDTLARLVWTKQSRRTALATLFGASLLGRVLDPVTATKRKRKIRPCYRGTNCHLGPGKDNAGCDFEGSVAFFEGNFQGSNLSGANLTGAQLANADLSGVNLRDACLVGANLLGADLAGANLDGAVFCRTLMPDGAIDDSGCDRGTRCCPTPEPICRICGGGNCLGSINETCSIFGTPCCAGLACTATVAGFFTTCQVPCDSDQDCAKFGADLKCCAGQMLVCPFFPGARCCQPPGPLTC